MSEFSGTVAALLAGKTVRAALLIVITWSDASVTRLWTGDGKIVIAGKTYLGSGRLVSVDGLSANLGTAAPTATFKLSGVDADTNAKAVAQRDLAVDAEITCYVQTFGDGVFAGEWQPLDNPVAIGTYQGDQLTFERHGPQLRTITLTAVSFFATRSRNLSSYYTDRDQQRRYLGDRGGEFMAALQNAKINFPFSG